jgi:hypothetical protein
MPSLYIVRCDFVRADLEQAWNDWYSGEKIRQMLAKPMFRAAQRFLLAGGSGRRYLALWQLASPEALATAEYSSDWGFAEWRPHIADWSRDLFDAAGAQDADFAVPSGGALLAISFDGMDAQQADAARGMVPERFSVTWLASVGLDRHTPTIGLRALTDAKEAQAALALPVPAGMQVGLYRPITAYCSATACAPTVSAR